MALAGRKLVITEAQVCYSATEYSPVVYGGVEMVRQFAIALAAAGTLGTALTMAPTEASAQTYYYTAWYPSYRPVTATYAAPVLVRKPVTVYTYAWEARPYKVGYLAPAWRPVTYAWAWGSPPVVAKGK